MDINKIAKEMTREEFLNSGYVKRVDEEKDFIEYECCGYHFLINSNCCSNCKECWEDAIKDIKFKGEDFMENKIDYDREYNIMEIMESPEGTEFVQISDKLFVKIGYSNNWECKILIGGYTERPCKLSDIWTKSKFKLIRKDKKVTFEEAIQAYGKTVYCIWRDKNDKMLKTFYEIKSNVSEISDTNNSAMCSEEILNGGWYIKED